VYQFIVNTIEDISLYYLPIFAQFNTSIFFALVF